MGIGESGASLLPWMDTISVRGSKIGSGGIDQSVGIGPPAEWWAPDSGVLFRLDYALGGRDGNQLVLSFSNVF